MFVCTTLMQKYMKLQRNDENNLSDSMHVWIKIYWEFYHCIIYIANEGHERNVNYYIINT
jgi:hypothetical protein